MSVEAKLKESAFGFHLCGSRFLGTAEPASDWDYVVSKQEGVEAFLRSLGFVRKAGGAQDYDGSPLSATIGVYEIMDNGRKIQVAVETDSKYKLAIMQALLASKTLRDFDKSLRGNKDGRNTLWYGLYHLAGWRMSEESEPKDLTSSHY